MKEYEKFLLAETLEDLNNFYNPEVQIISYDIETYIKEEFKIYTSQGKLAKKQPMHNWRNAHPRLHQFYAKKAYPKPVIVDVKKFDSKGFKNFLKPLFTDKTKQISAFNAMFDGCFLYGYYGILPINLYCTKVMSIIFFAGLKSAIECTYKTKKINNLAATYQRVFPEEGLVIDKTEQSSDWSGALKLSQLKYAADDTIYNDKLFRVFKKALTNLSDVVEAEQQGLVAFIAASVDGFSVDYDQLQSVKESYKNASETSLSKLMELLGQNINPNSPQQVKTVLTNQGFEIKGTGVNDLAHLKGNLIIDTLLLYKSITTGLKKVITLEKHYNFETQVIHGEFNSLAPQGTGRSTSVGSNLQNIPRLKVGWSNSKCLPIRTMFQHPDPDYRIVSVDSSGCHVQIAREYSQDPELIRIAKEGLDPYIILGIKMLELQGTSMEYDYVKKIVKDKKHPLNYEFVEKRQLWKKTFLSRLNDASAKKIKDSLAANDPPIFLPLEDCQIAVKAWDELFSVLAAFKKRAVRKANDNEQISPFGLYLNYNKYESDPDVPKKTLRTNQFGLVTALDGGYYYVPKQWAFDKFGCKNTEVVAFLWQRIEGSCIKRTAYDCVIWLQEKGYTQQRLAWLCNINHDEPVFVAHKSVAEELADFCGEAMVRNFRLYVKDYSMKDDPKDGILNNWNEKG